MDARRESKDDGRHDFQAESFIQLGDYLSSLERRRATASTQTSANENAQSPSSQKTTNINGWRTLAIKWALVMIVIVLVGTNAYVLKAKSSLEAENSTLRTRVAEFDRQNEIQPSKRSFGSCPNDIVDNCIFKIGLGPCAKEAFDNPIGQVEHALGLAWNSTAEIIEALGSTIAKDFNHLGREIQSAGTAAMNLLGISPCHRK